MFECIICGADLHWSCLGKLGSLFWFSCRYCGMEQTHNAPAFDEQEAA